MIIITAIASRIFILILIVADVIIHVLVGDTFYRVHSHTHDS